MVDESISNDMASLHAGTFSAVSRMDVEHGLLATPQDEEHVGRSRSTPSGFAAARQIPLLLPPFIPTPAKQMILDTYQDEAEQQGYDPAGVPHYNGAVAHIAKDREQAQRELEETWVEWFATVFRDVPALAHPHIRGARTRRHARLPATRLSRTGRRTPTRRTHLPRPPAQPAHHRRNRQPQPSRRQRRRDRTSGTCQPRLIIKPWPASRRAGSG